MTFPGSDATPPLVRTGVDGFDDVLGGGFTPHRLYLLEGAPGSGKTTLALQFLQEGVRLGEPVLYVTLSETESELRQVAESHGWSLDGITIREMTPSEDALVAEGHYTMFHPSEVELGETTKSILEEVERIRPTRVVFDSLSEVRLLAGSALRYRRQILALKVFFAGRQCTVLLLDDMTSVAHDLQVQSIAHGAVRLEQLAPEYGSNRRRMMVLKYRGRAFRGGYHDYQVRRGGIEVFPRLVASEMRVARPRTDRIGSGVEALDALLGGGLDRGTSTLIVGAPGTGKSSLASFFAKSAADRGEKAALFIFDESAATLKQRALGLGSALDAHLASGAITIQQVDPAELSPGEFAQAIKSAVLAGVGVIVIDSLNGYLNAMPEEKFLIIQLHELLSFLGNAGVATVLIGAHQGLIGTQMSSPVDASYLADAIVLMRYFESRGQVRQAISVVKKRGGPHERSIREIKLESTGIWVGPPLREFQGVLTGVPTGGDTPAAPRAVP
jgi:circadian clock protein KaiC